MLMDAKSELTPQNKLYLKALNQFIWVTYQLDLPEKDMTTRWFLEDLKKEIVAEVFSRQKGILSGIKESKWFLNKIGIKILRSKKEGEVMKKGESILKIKSSADKILGAERTLLNLLQRMSGIATKTQMMGSKLSKPIKLLATRKTLWGLIDKKAVTDGGGGTHRLNLADAILIKDNHIALNKDFQKSLERCLKPLKKIRFLEVELESEAQIRAFLEWWKSRRGKINEKKLVVMLDNFTPNKIKKWAPLLQRQSLQVEVSGGINEENIKQFNLPGVTYISSSAMTMSAPHLDLSLEITPSKK